MKNKNRAKDYNETKTSFLQKMLIYDNVSKNAATYSKMFFAFFYFLSYVYMCISSQSIAFLSPEEKDAGGNFTPTSSRRQRL